MSNNIRFYLFINLINSKNEDLKIHVQIPHKKDFVFSELSKSVSNKKNDNCKNVILSDIGSVLILKNNCK